MGMTMQYKGVSVVHHALKVMKEPNNYQRSKPKGSPSGQVINHATDEACYRVSFLSGAWHWLDDRGVAIRVHDDRTSVRTIGGMVFRK